MKFLYHGTLFASALLFMSTRAPQRCLLLFQTAVTFFPPLLHFLQRVSSLRSPPPPLPPAEQSLNLFPPSFIPLARVLIPTRSPSSKEPVDRFSLVLSFLRTLDPSRRRIPSPSPLPGLVLPSCSPPQSRDFPFSKTVTPFSK